MERPSGQDQVGETGRRGQEEIRGGDERLQKGPGHCVAQEV